MDSPQHRFVGIGRKLRLYYHMAEVWEGQFKNNMLHGFGRYMRFFGKAGYECYVGNWKDDRRHGYGRFIDYNGDVDEGLFHRAVSFDCKTVDPESLKLSNHEICGTYNPDTDPIATKIRFERYGHKNEIPEEWT